VGKPAAAGIPYIGMPAVAPVALSFHLFGVGPWQLRLPGILVTVGALGLLYSLSRSLFDPSVALTTLCAALLLSAHSNLHPVLLGRQALGEMPAMFFLLAGFSLFSWGWKRTRWSMALAVPLWAIATQTKPQTLPFLLAGLALPLLVAAAQRRWRTSGWLAFGLLGTLAASWLLGRGQDLLLRSPLFAPTSGHKLYSWLGAEGDFLQTNVIVLDLSVRLLAPLLVVFFGMPLVLGLSYAGWKALSKRHRLDLEGVQDLPRMIVWTCAASWFGWYLVASIGWLRYLMPAAFLGSIFVGLLLQDIAGGFKLWALVMQGVQSLKRPFSVRAIGRVAAAVFIPAAFALTLWMFYDSYIVTPDDSVHQAAHFLNTETASDSVIETYETELFFLLDRGYHFPPDQVQNQLIRRKRDSRVVVDYDPLSADPDYLVVGRFADITQLYAPILETGLFRLAFDQGMYQVYERVR
jgi:4-amino-4-deoxy-L-arabinose transferase-like glycosyltransferase